MDGNNITLRDIKKEVERYKRIEDLSTKIRKQYIVDSRYAYYALCKYYYEELGKPSLEKIGDCVNRDHSSVIHGLNQFKALKNNKSFSGLDTYLNCKVNISELVFDNIDFKNLINKKEYDVINRFYRQKHIRLSNKYRSVINKYKDKLYLLKQDEFINKIINLEEEDLKELKIKFDTFMKVKESLNKNRVV